MYRSRRRWGQHTRTAASPIKRTQGYQVKRRGKCGICGKHIDIGTEFVRLRLKKAFCVPCPICGVSPRGVKRFHPACEPTDDALRNKTMGYFPGGHQIPLPPPAAAPTPPPTNHVPIPPPQNRPVAPMKPVSSREASLNAFVALEQAFLAKMREANPDKRAALEKDFRQYQGLKQHVIHQGGNSAEQETALPIAITKMVKLVYA